MKTRESLEGAVWQFFIDHSLPHKKGTTIKNRNDLFRRIRAREDGYVRLPEEKYQQWIADYWAHKVVNDKKAKAMGELRIRGPWYIKILFKIKNWIDEYLVRRAGFRNKYW